MARPLWAAEIVHNDDVARREDGHENLLDISAEAAPLIGPSMTQGAVRPSQRSAARNVRVRHLPKGALATRRWTRRSGHGRASSVGFGPGLVDEDKPPGSILA